MRAAAAAAYGVAIFRDAGVDDLGFVVMAVWAFHGAVFEEGWLGVDRLFQYT